MINSRQTDIVRNCCKSVLIPNDTDEMFSNQLFVCDTERKYEPLMMTVGKAFRFLPFTETPFCNKFVFL